MEEQFYRRHWICVGHVTEAAKTIIRGTGGDCLLVPQGVSIPSLVLVYLPADIPDWGLIFCDLGYALEIGIGHQGVTLYSRTLSPALIEQSIETLTIATPEEWQAFWNANGPPK